MATGDGKVKAVALPVPMVAVQAAFAIVVHDLGDYFECLGKCVRYHRRASCTEAALGGDVEVDDKGNIFVVRWRTLVVERSAVLVHIIVDVLAAVAWTRLARCIFELDTEREPLGGFGAFPGPRGDV